MSHKHAGRPAGISDCKDSGRTLLAIYPGLFLSAIGLRRGPDGAFASPAQGVWGKHDIPPLFYNKVY